MNNNYALSNPYLERMTRQIPIFGVEGQRRIANTKIAIIGCGGNGSAVCYLSALAGFQTMNLLDMDKLELHNLNRFMLGGVRDIGEHKVTIAKRALHRLFPDMKIRTITKDIRTPGIWEHVRGCDWLLEAMDNDESRHFLQQMCSRDNVPIISLASGFITRNDQVIGAGCRINRVGRGDPCLGCQVLDEEPMEQAQISLVIPNMIAAALALDTLVRNVTGYADQVFDYETDNIQENKQSISKPYDSNNFTLFDLINRTLVTERIIPSPRCKLCGSNRD